MSIVINPWLAFCAVQQKWAHKRPRQKNTVWKQCAKRNDASLTDSWGNATNRVRSWDVACHSCSLGSRCCLSCCCLLLHLSMTLPKIKYLQKRIHTSTTKWPCTKEHIETDSSFCHYNCKHNCHGIHSLDTWGTFLRVKAAQEHNSSTYIPFLTGWPAV